jgi:hypothetical protein
MAFVTGAGEKRKRANAVITGKIEYNTARPGERVEAPSARVTLFLPDLGRCQYVPTQRPFLRRRPCRVAWFGSWLAGNVLRRATQARKEDDQKAWGRRLLAGSATDVKCNNHE